MKRFTVHGWLNGDSYDAGNKSDTQTEVTAKSQSEAESIADKRFAKKFGNTCEVVEAISFVSL